jgi:hypothetical protein
MGASHKWLSFNFIRIPERVGVDLGGEEAGWAMAMRGAKGVCIGGLLILV